MSTRNITSTNYLQGLAVNPRKDQYNLWQILGIWVSAALPMGLVYWVIMPILLLRGSVNPFTYLFLMIAGLIWEGVLAYLLLLLFTAYHLHFFWTTPTRLIVNWIYALPTKRFKSYWMGVIIHGFGAVFLIFQFIMAIMGLIQN